MIRTRLAIETGYEPRTQKGCRSRLLPAAALRQAARSWPGSPAWVTCIADTRGTTICSVARRAPLESKGLQTSSGELSHETACIFSFSSYLKSCVYRASRDLRLLGVAESAEIHSGRRARFFRIPGPARGPGVLSQPGVATVRTGAGLPAAVRSLAQLCSG